MTVTGPLPAGIPCATLSTPQDPFPIQSRWRLQRSELEAFRSRTGRHGFRTGQCSDFRPWDDGSLNRNHRRRVTLMCGYT